MAAFADDVSASGKIISIRNDGLGNEEYKERYIRDTIEK